MLFLRLEQHQRIQVGKLGTLGFSASHYLYFSSALGGPRESSATDPIKRNFTGISTT